MCKELKDSMEEVKKTMCEQNGSAVEEIENPRRWNQKDSGAKKIPTTEMKSSPRD